MKQNNVLQCVSSLNIFKQNCLNKEYCKTYLSRGNSSPLKSEANVFLFLCVLSPGLLSQTSIILLCRRVKKLIFGCSSHDIWNLEDCAEPLLCRPAFDMSVHICQCLCHSLPAYLLHDFHIVPLSFPRHGTFVDLWKDERSHATCHTNSSCSLQAEFWVAKAVASMLDSLMCIYNNDDNKHTAMILTTRVVRIMMIICWHSWLQRLLM